MKPYFNAILTALILLSVAPAGAQDGPPWGGAKAQAIDYKPQKVVYDVAVPGERALSNVLDRASYLNNIYQADPFATSIVLVLHGNEIPLFAVENVAKHRELMRRAQSLTVGGTITFRMCEQAAKGHGYEPKDIHGFVEIVPMADAEIIRLQQEEGHVYMR